MQRYFFDIHDGDRLHADDEGVVLLDLESARVEATQTLGHMSCDHAVRSAPHRFSIEIRDVHKRLLLVATLTLEVKALQH